mmetsp:Transcript_16051/g.44976  ORF Transcript_16051/g.44976 Transcript_16051/m.44976 type:complete len:329 (+) Transcript_16051:2333-3319(+)
MAMAIAIPVAVVVSVIDIRTLARLQIAFAWCISVGILIPVLLPIFLTSLASYRAPSPARRGAIFIVSIAIGFVPHDGIVGAPSWRFRLLDVASAAVVVAVAAVIVDEAAAVGRSRIEAFARLPGAYRIGYPWRVVVALVWIVRLGQLIDGQSHGHFLLVCVAFRVDRITALVLVLMWVLLGTIAMRRLVVVVAVVVALAVRVGAVHRRRGWLLAAVLAVGRWSAISDGIEIWQFIFRALLVETAALDALGRSKGIAVAVAVAIRRRPPPPSVGRGPGGVVVSLQRRRCCCCRRRRRHPGHIRAAAVLRRVPASVLAWFLVHAPVFLQR